MATLSCRALSRGLGDLGASFSLQFSSPLQSWARASQRQSHFKILKTYPSAHHLSSSVSVLQRLFLCSYMSLPGFSFLLPRWGQMILSRDPTWLGWGAHMKEWGTPSLTVAGQTMGEPELVTSRQRPLPSYRDVRLQQSGRRYDIQGYQE